jgi:hypothetical protein
MCRNVRSIDWHQKTYHEISWDYPFCLRVKDIELLQLFFPCFKIASPILHETSKYKKNIHPKEFRMNAFRLGCPRNKQTKIFGLNRNKPKLNLFRLFFGLFCETNRLFFRFVSVRFGVSDPFRNNRNKQICFETNRKKLNKLWKKQ